MNEIGVIKEMEAYFTEIRWTDHAKQKVGNLLSEYKKSVSKKQDIIKKVEYVPHNIVDTIRGEVMDDEVAEEVCERHGITINQLKGKGQSNELVTARADFTLEVKRRYKFSTLVGIGKYLNRHHSTIVNIKRKILMGYYQKDK